MERVVQSVKTGPWLKIMLNRPKMLNAVDTKVSKLGIYKLATNVLDENVKAVIGGGVGRAVAAGGDVRHMEYHMSRNEPVLVESYLRAEYQFYYLMNSLPKPSVIFMPQIAMGGGLGFSAKGTLRIVSDKSRIAMPENKIGLFADVGSSHYMQNYHPGSGKLLSLTGRTMSGEEALQIGIATHLVPLSRYEEMQTKIQSRHFENFTEIEKIVESFAEPKKNISMEKDEIYSAFDERDFSTIVQNLSKLNSAESAEALAQLEQVCPLSVLLSNEIFNLGQGETYANCLRNEFRMNRVQFRDHNFGEGVRALLVDKGRKPHWNPATLITSDIPSEIEEHLRRCKLPTVVQDQFLCQEAAPETKEAQMISWHEILQDSSVIEHFYPDDLP